MLPVVGDIAQSDGGISRSTERQLGIVKTCLGMVLGKVSSVSVTAAPTVKYALGISLEISAKSSLAMAWKSGKKAALGSTAPP